MTRLTLCLLLVLLGCSTTPAMTYRSHPPMRPLPVASSRAMAEGPARFVDGAKGDDAGDGTKGKPWKTIRHAAAKLKPGETLYLRGGVYHEALTLTLQGKPGQPITIRSHPGELA